MLSDDQFARLVAEDVKNRVTDEQARYLRLTDNRSRWQRALELLLENLNDQMLSLDSREQIEVTRFKALGDSGSRLLAEFQTEQHQRQRKIERFRFYVETRLDEVHRLRAIDSADPDERAAATDFYRNAIAMHKKLVVANDLDYAEVDEALWAVLDGAWTFDELTFD